MTEPDPHADPKQEDIEVSVLFDPDQSLLRLGIIDPPVRPGLVGNLDRFELLKRIGAGGMGVVYLARDSVSGQRVAVKVLKPDLLEHAATVRHFLREARLMQALSHPGILPIIELSNRPSGPYFATPLIEPGSLASHIRTTGPLDHGTVSDVALQIAEALDYCHKRGVIHRDIKPANVLLDREGRAYLCDLGLGQSLTDVSITYVKEDKRVGTAAYMAPEIVRGDAGDSRCDVYSFGAMLYEMLTGQPPYSGQTFHGVLAKIQAGPPEPIMSVNPKADGRLARVAEGAMARELRDRYATMADVAADIERSRATQAVLGSKGTDKPKAIFVRKLGLAGVSLCLLIGTIFLAYWTWMGNNDSVAPAGWAQPGGNRAGWAQPGGNRQGLRAYPNGSQVPTTNQLLLETSLVGTVVLTGDVDGDGILETVTTSGDQLRVCAEDWSIQTQVTMPGDGRVTMIEDVDGDGVADIGIGGMGDAGGHVYFYDGAGTLLQTLTRTVGYDGYMTPMGVLDGGKVLIAGYAAYSKDPRGLYAYGFAAGTEVWGYDLGGFGILQPSMADIDGDGKDEFTIGWSTVGNGNSANGTTDRDLYLVVLDDDGTNLVSQIYPSPSNGKVGHLFVDLDRNGTTEVLGIERHDPTYYHGISQVHLYDTAGNTLYSYDGPNDEAWMWAVADTDGDGKDNVIVGGQTTLVILDEHLNDVVSVADDGEVELACDLTGDGNPEIVTRNASGLIRVYNSSLVLLDSLQLTRAGQIAASDVDADGVVELLIPTRSGQIAVVAFAAGQVVLGEDFEATAVDSWPDGWIADANAVSHPSNSRVVADPAPSRPLVSRGKASRPDGLVAYYPFDGDANDESGNGNNATVHGPKLTKDRFGRANHAYLFDGLNDYMDSLPARDIPSVSTVSLWIQSTGKAGSNQIFGSIETTDGGKDGLVGDFDGDDLRTRMIYYSSNVGRGNTDGPNGSVSLDTWTHLAFTVDPLRNVKIYANGELDANGTFSALPTSHDRALMFGKGAYSGGGSHYFGGYMDDVRIYERALSAAEVKTLYGRECLTPPAGTPKSQGDEKHLTLDLGDGVAMKLVHIPAGKFTMGSPKTETGRDDDEGPQRQVTITKPFYMGVTEVTQAQWTAVMNTRPWEGQKDAKTGAGNAASWMSWDDATAFCKASLKKTGRTVRLPTEAEWEYACRAGRAAMYSFGDDSSKLGDYAWYKGNSDSKGERYAHPVGVKKPNTWGLCDMHGNAYEWCADWNAGSYANADARDPKGPATGKARVLRGGAWVYDPDGCRAAGRGWNSPGLRLSFFGFRVVVESAPAAPATVSLALPPEPQDPKSDPRTEKAVIEPSSDSNRRAGEADRALRELGKALQRLTDTKPASAIRQQEETAKPMGTRRDMELDLGNKVTMKLVLIPAGKFVMGSPKGERGRHANEGPQHEVTMSKPFYMGVYEVTQEQYAQVLGMNPRWFKGAKNPVETVSWFDAAEFCEKLSQKTGKTVRLPKEAQWEYACRAGSKTRFCFGDDDGDLDGYAWYASNSASKTHPVGGKKPNAFGLYDMHGNVWEWCSDRYVSYANADKRAPARPDCWTHCVLRGGSWFHDLKFCRSASRLGHITHWPSIVYIGFRVVVDLPSAPSNISLALPSVSQEPKSGPRTEKSNDSNRRAGEADRALRELGKSLRGLTGAKPASAVTIPGPKRPKTPSTAKSDQAGRGPARVPSKSHLPQTQPTVAGSRAGTRWVYRAGKWQRASPPETKSPPARRVSGAPAVLLPATVSDTSADSFGTGGNQFKIDFVTISGSTNPTSGIPGRGKFIFAGVNNDYRMGTYEITNDQWHKFVASLGIPVTGDPLSAYDYRPDWTGANVPVNKVSWHQAAQFVNWLNTSTGHHAAYNFTGTQGTGDYTLATWNAEEADNGTNLYRHKDAFYYLPTENEWVKAAYWNGTTLQTYANASPDDLVSGVPDPTKWNYGPSAGSGVWDVGSGIQELNGTYDMMGNISDLLESPNDVTNYAPTSYRVRRGGSLGFVARGLASSHRGWYAPLTSAKIHIGWVGFRVASEVPADRAGRHRERAMPPVDKTPRFDWWLLLAAVGVLVVLALGVAAMFRRRRPT